MDGAAGGPERPEDPASKDPQSPEGQAQARIRNLEDSLFSLQSQLQLLQSASTGAQHRPAGRPAWRREGPRPLSQPAMETGPTGPTDVDKRTSLPDAPVGMSPESPSDPREESIGVPPALRPSPEAIETSSEANGPCSGLSPLPEQLRLGVSSVAKAKGDGAVEVVWAGLRATENSVTGPTGVELEAKVEEVVLEAIGTRQSSSSSPELPTWVKEGRDVVEVVWEGLGGRDLDVTGELGRGAEATHTSSPRLQEQFEAETCRKGGGTSRDSLEGVGQGGPGVEEGSFIWVERVALSEDWEEILMEGLEAAPGAGSAGGPEASMGAQPGGAEASWEVETREVVQVEGIEENGRTEKLGGEREDGPAVLPDMTQGREESEVERAERKAGEGPFPTETETEEEKWEVKAKKDEEPLEVEKGGEEETGTTEKPLVAEEKPDDSVEAERKGSEMPSDQEKDAEGSLDRESKTAEKLLDEETGGEGSLDEETGGSKKPLDREASDGEPFSEVDKPSGAKDAVRPEEQGTSDGGAECQAEDASPPGATVCAQEEPRPEEPGPQDPETQVGEAASEPPPCTQSEGPPGDATPLLAETPAPEQPVERQPLLHQEVSSTNRDDHPAPTYAPAQQLELAEAREASGPKQKTCQCCVVM
ncbi:paralemmin-3 [Apodemus sylvaticus]|uniref:paralemmin-3 n=1 Tax=Apodemus sylvaticus TaxID=10129 RepID=UPI0022434ABC|nr:paralemmin-3 [Apodemus sylvaticus]